MGRVVVYATVTECDRRRGDASVSRPERAAEPIAPTHALLVDVG